MTDADRAVLAAALRLVYCWQHGLVAMDDAEHDLADAVRQHPAWLPEHEAGTESPPLPSTSSTATLPRRS